VPFAVSITTPDQFHSKLLHLNSGETIYIRINDVRNKGNTYSMTMRKDNVSRRSIREVANPDPAELNNDDLKQNATLLPLDTILDHSLSNNNGTYGDVDWFVFTAP